MALHVSNCWCDGVLLQQVEDLIDDVVFGVKNTFNFRKTVLEEVRDFLDET